MPLGVTAPMNIHPNHGPAKSDTPDHTALHCMRHSQ